MEVLWGLSNNVFLLCLVDVLYLHNSSIYATELGWPMIFRSKMLILGVMFELHFCKITYSFYGEFYLIL